MIRRAIGVTSPIPFTERSSSRGASRIPLRLPKREIKAFAGSFYIEAGDGECKEQLYNFIIGKSFQTIFEEPFTQALSVSEIMREIRFHFSVFHLYGKR